MNKKQAKVVEAYHVACNALAEEINQHLFDGSRQWYWVGSDVGGLCDFNDTDFLVPEDMARILENGMTYEQYAEWRDANIEHRDTEGTINLRSWLMECRHSMLADKTKEE